MRINPYCRDFNFYVITIQDHGNEFGRHFSEPTTIKPSRLVTFTQRLFEDARRWQANLRTAGLKADLLCGRHVFSALVSREPTTEAGKALKFLTDTMKSVGHAVYRGFVYRKHEEGKLNSGTSIFQLTIYLCN